jgi:small subunit ribosomal protein S20
MRQSEKRRLRNRAVIKDIKLQIKKVQEAAKAGDADKLRTEVRLAIQRLDKAATRGTVHPNLTARKKSQLARLLNAKVASPKS